MAELLVPLSVPEIRRLLAVLAWRLAPAAPRPAVSHDACPRWLPTNDLVSVLATGVREAAGHLAGRQTAADTSLATCAGHRLSGRQSFRKQRTVNPLIVP